MNTYQEICKDVGVPLNKDNTLQSKTSLILALKLIELKCRLEFLGISLGNSHNCCCTGGKILLSDLLIIVGKQFFSAKPYQGVWPLIDVFTMS